MALAALLKGWVMPTLFNAGVSVTRTCVRLDKQCIRLVKARESRHIPGKRVRRYTQLLACPQQLWAFLFFDGGLWLWRGEQRLWRLLCRSRFILAGNMVFQCSSWHGWMKGAFQLYCVFCTCGLAACWDSMYAMLSYHSIACIQSTQEDNLQDIQYINVSRQQTPLWKAPNSLEILWRASSYHTRMRSRLALCYPIYQTSETGTKLLHVITGLNCHNHAKQIRTSLGFQLSSIVSFPQQKAMQIARGSGHRRQDAIHCSQLAFANTGGLPSKTRCRR